MNKIKFRIGNGSYSMRDAIDGLVWARNNLIPVVVLSPDKIIGSKKIVKTDNRYIQLVLILSYKALMCRAEDYPIIACALRTTVVE